MSDVIQEIFLTRAKEYEERRTRSFVEEMIRNHLYRLHVATFKNVPSAHVTVSAERNGICTRFIFKTNPIDTRYQTWYIDINIIPFIRNYDDWMKGGNEEWKNHLKPYHP